MCLACARCVAAPVVAIKSASRAVWTFKAMPHAPFLFALKSQGPNAQNEQLLLTGLYFGLYLLSRVSDHSLRSFRSGYGVGPKSFFSSSTSPMKTFTSSKSILIFGQNHSVFQKIDFFDAGFFDDF